MRRLESIDLASRDLKVGMYFARLDGAGILSITPPVVIGK